MVQTIAESTPCSWSLRCPGIAVSAAEKLEGEARGGIVEHRYGDARLDFRCHVLQLNEHTTKISMVFVFRNEWGKSGPRHARIFE